MTVKWRYLAWLALILSGCNSDPAMSRLPMGSNAMLYSATANEVIVADQPATKVKGIKLVPVGTRVTILADDAEPFVLSGKDLRDVRISVNQGPFQGYVGKVDRHELRPVT
jgi:hypothetical protein